jgi:class 3 adenylate cyclase
LARACEGCGFDNEADERFCGGCGRRLASGDDEDAPRAERRQVSVLFADLTGYTTLSSRLDPEDVHRILERFFDAADGAVAQYGGSIDKHIGDNVMALFGAPVAHDDDPERAVRAALAIQAGVAELSQELGFDIGVHIGVAAGEVVASSLGSRHHQAYTVTGNAVNLAARL